MAVRYVSRGGRIIFRNIGGFHRGMGYYRDVPYPGRGVRGRVVPPEGTPVMALPVKDVRAEGIMQAQSI
jgi:hypothetical protein